MRRAWSERLRAGLKAFRMAWQGYGGYGGGALWSDRSPGWGLLPEFGDAARECVEWDRSRVAALREDLTAQYPRKTLAVKGGWMTVEEARAKAGL